MKQRWKKIASLMLVTICAFSLTACGKKEETAAYQQITDDMVTNCAEVSQSAVESLAGFDDETLNQMTANRDTFTRLAVSAWMDQENELGKYEEMGTPTTDIDREEGQPKHWIRQRRWMSGFREFCLQRAVCKRAELQTQGNSRDIFIQKQRNR